MDAYLYHNKSDKRRIDKELEQIGGLIHIEFIDESSNINPILKVDSGLQPFRANYLILADFTRCYYINNYVVCNGYIRLECEVDVLMSFREELLEAPVLLDRSSDKYNLYLPDSMLPIEEPTCVRTIKFADAFTTETNFILVLAGSNSGGDEPEGSEE